MPPDLPVKLLIAGCGDMAGTWLRSVQGRADVQLVGLTDLRLEKARERQQEFAPSAAVDTDFIRLLDATQPDVVFNCTVPEAHHAISTAALRAGCHVLSEKPLADSLAAARAIAAEAAAAKRSCAVMQNRRYTRGARQVRALIAAGTLGTITEIGADFYVGAHFGGFRDTMEHVLLLDMSIHHFDLARFLSGADATAVYCREWNPEGSWYRHGANAHAIFELQRGIVFNYRGSWCAEGQRTSWNANWRIVGTRGTLLWDGELGIALDLVATTGSLLSEYATTRIEPTPAPAHEHGHASVIQEFLACIATGRTPETSAADNLHSLAMVFGAIDSAQRTQRIPISS